MKFHYLARAIVERNGKILLAKEKGSKFTSLPGGHIEFSESAKKCLKRELIEETGLNAFVGKFIGAVEHNWGDIKNLNSEINLLFKVTFEYEDEIISKEPHLEFIWADIKKIEKYNLRPAPLIEIISSFTKSGYESAFWGSTIE